MGSASVFNTTSDFELRLALGFGLMTLVASVGLVLQVLSMRLRAQQREHARLAVQTRWRPVLVQAAVESGEDGVAMPRLPALAHRELTDVLLLWTQMQDGLRGSAHAGLNRLALQLGFAEQARRWAARGRLAQRVIGLVVLGHLGLPEDRERLRVALDDPRTLVSLAGARALLQIDAAGNAPQVLDQYLGRPDWPAARLGTLLRDAGAEAVAPALLERLLAAAPAEQIRLLPLLRFAETPRSGSVLEQLVARSEDPQVLSIALRQLHGPDALERVRKLCESGDALVRSAAAVALGRIGEPIDRVRLVILLSDRDWWVRYRAAQALVTMPGLDETTLRRLRAGLTDRYAGDMLEHAWAERALHGGGAQAASLLAEPVTAETAVPR